MVQLSIVIPHFNRSLLLRQTIDSVWRQQCDCEVIIVDDGSSESEFAAVLSLQGPRLKVLRREDGQRGPSRCRNLGWQAASADLILFLDSDDLLAPWCAEQRLRAAAESRADAMVFPVMLFREQPGDWNTLWNRLEGDDPALRFLTSDPPWQTSSALWRRAALESIGGFNEAVMYGDDSELHARALICGVSFEIQTAAMADVFIRRSTAARITNSVSDALLNSRLERLRATSAWLVKCDREDYRQAWQGQYFAECEFLLFGVPGSRQRQISVLAAWRQDWSPAWQRHLAVAAYLWVGAVCRSRAYLLLRIARRLVMLLLPGVYFAKAPGFENAPLTTQEFDRLQKLLQTELGDNGNCRGIRAD
jgi:glycosyltransferase involved in cell wall biosynthesis